MATKQFTLNFPNQDGPFSATLETFQQAAYRMDMPEEQLLVEALGFYLASVRNEEGQIPNYRACNKQIAERGIPRQSANLKTLFQKLEGEPPCSQDVPKSATSSAAGSLTRKT